MTKRRLASFLAVSLGADAQGASPEAAAGVIPAMAKWLQQMVRHYDSLEWTVTPDGLQRTDEFPVSAFHGRPLSASIEGFIRRICSLAKLEDSVVLVAAVYLRRILEKCPDLPISSCTVHRLLLQAVAVGAKFSLDHPRSNKVMASLVQMAPKKYNQLEIKFLCLIQYDLAVSPADLATARSSLGMVEMDVEEQERCEDANPRAYKKIKLGSSMEYGTTYTTFECDMGTTEEGSVYSEGSEVEAMSHLEECNNFTSTDIVGEQAQESDTGVVTPCLSESSPDSTAVSPGWSAGSATAPPAGASPNNSINNYDPNNYTPNTLLEIEAESQKQYYATTTLEDTKLSSPERNAYGNHVVATAAE